MNETGNNPGYRALFRELRQLGYVEGRNLIVERYSAEGGGRERYAEIAPNVVHTKPDLICATSNLLVLSFKAATDTIPIVGFMSDPVAWGVVASLARPGGNITGVAADAGLEIWGKRLEILRETIPTASRVGFLTLAPWQSPQTVAMQEPARLAGMSLLGPALEPPIQDTEYRRVLSAMVQQRADGLMVGDTSINFTHRQLIVDLVEKARLPAIYPYRAHVEIGGLMSYAPATADLWRRLGGYIDQVLKGEQPGEIPIYLETKFELVINLKTAKALGLTIPRTLLARADEVIE
jgi:putative ABC transport system substrate-binding protein